MEFSIPTVGVLGFPKAQNNRIMGMAASPINIPFPVNAISVGSPHISPNSSFVTVTNNNDRCFVNHPLLSLTDHCTSLPQLKQIHAQFLRVGLFFDPYSASKLFSAFAMSPLCDLGYAQKVFDQIPQPNLYTWNALLRAYASGDDPIRSLSIFIRMLHECPDIPNKFTFPSVIKAASSVVDDANLGKAIYGMAVKLRLGSDLFVLNSLVRLYGACGNLDMAYKVFLSIQNKDVVSWNSMIAAYVQEGCPDMALELFRVMEVENVKPNEVTMVGIFSACAKIGNLELGRMMHLHVEKNGIKSCLILNNAILDMYTKCGNMDDAKRFFDDMEDKDVVSGTTMLVGYAKLQKFAEARHVFDAMPVRDIATRNALISAYEQTGRPKEALSLFPEFLASRSTKAEKLTESL